MLRKIMLTVISWLLVFCALLSRVFIWLLLIGWVSVWLLLSGGALFYIDNSISCQEDGRFVRMFFYIGMAFVVPTLLYIRHLLRNKREREEEKKNLRETIATLENKPKVTRRKQGKYRSGNWASKWIAYSNDIATPRRSHVSIELPPLPRVNEERVETDKKASKKHGR